MTKKTCNFQAEIDQVLHLVIHSLYTNKDIFLRELISNASDACDKLKFISKTQENVLDNSGLKISIILDKDNSKIHILDNGIGMDQEDLVHNIGTVANSGTKKFLQEIREKGETNLIGQFGVGFYSAFMVSDFVEIRTKKYNSEKAWKWSSNGQKEFTIEEDKEKLDRGTEIILRIRDTEKEYLDRFRIDHIVHTYSDHISIPIELMEVGKDEAKILNSSSALWTRNKSDISEQEYKEFYKKTALSADEPWAIIHNKNEGKINYTNLLFIPATKTFDLFHPDRKRRVKLYINRVFINDEAIDLVPQYLRFLRGVVDAEDIPLNVSRENLQHNQILGFIKDSITKRIINLLEKKLLEEKDSYIDFWKNFGPVIKEGLCESMNVPDNLIDICVFWSAKKNKYITFKEYVEDVKEDQKEIFYISGDDYEKAKQHPQLEGFLNKGYDVLFFVDTVDDFWVSAVSKYKDFEFKSITRSNIDLNKKGDTNKNSKDELSKEQEKLLSFIKDVLGNKIESAKLSSKLISLPACISVRDGALDIRMERYLIEQKQLKETAAKIFEINAEHPIIKGLSSLVMSKKNNELCTKIINLLFNQSCIIEGEEIKDPKEFVSTINDLILHKLNL